MAGALDPVSVPNESVRMANTADHFDSSEHELNLGTVDQLRVRVSYGRMLDGPSHDVFLLDVPVEADEAFDETPYIGALEPILYAGAETPLVYSMHVSRHHTSWGPALGEAEIRLNLTTGSRSATIGATALDALTLAFRSVLEHVTGRPERPEPRHDDAIALARVRVEEAFPEVHSDLLSVSDEEHRAAHGSWSIGLRTRDLDRYVVVIGFLDGYPDSAHIRHQPRSEVLDSVGSEIP
jgi:hypothetical protein